MKECEIGAYNIHLKQDCSKPLAAGSQWVLGSSICIKDVKEKHWGLTVSAQQPHPQISMQATPFDLEPLTPHWVWEHATKLEGEGVFSTCSASYSVMMSHCRDEVWHWKPMLRPSLVSSVFDMTVPFSLRSGDQDPYSLRIKWYLRRAFGLFRYSNFNILPLKLGRTWDVVFQ